MIDLTRLNDSLELVIVIGSALAVLGGWLRWVRPRWRALRAKFTAALDSIVGRPAVVDSITGAERVPALPGIGVRMEHQEQQMELLTTTVTKLVDQQQALVRLEEQVTQHSHAIAELQAGMVERIVAKQEQTEMWRAVQQMQAEGGPVTDADPVDPDELEQ